MWLLWREPATWLDVSYLKTPLGAAVGDVLAFVLIAGGVAMLIPRTTRAATLAVGSAVLALALGCLPAIAAAPGSYPPYIGFFEILAPVCAAFTLVLPRASRIGLGICTVSFTGAQIYYFAYTAKLVPVWLPPSQDFWAAFTTVAFGLAAIAILINRQAALAMRLTALMIALFGLLVWVPILAAHPEKHYDWSEFVLNYLIAGAVWFTSTKSR